MHDILDFKYFDRGKDSLNHKHHSHKKGYEIILVLSGSGIFLVGERAFEIKPNHLYLIDGMSAHCSSPEVTEDYTRRKLILGGQMLEEALRSTDALLLARDLFADGGRCFSLSKSALNAVNAAFSDIARAVEEQDPFSSLRVVKAVIEILLAANDGEREESLYHDADITNILKYISYHFSRPLRLDEISRETHISKYYLCRRFKECVGVTVFDYILSLRLSYAKKQLVYSDTSISQIAINAGFSDFAYFSRVFRENEGIPPRKYRLLHRQ